MKDGYQLIASTTDVAQGKTLCLQLDGREILLCHAKEGFFAIDNLCTHAEARLSEGKLKGCKILCPLHGAAFDVRDGSVLTRPARTPLASYPLRIEGEQIYVLTEATNA
ncbi:Naphthalene 1,2-dioxygenase system, ferredoxin component [Halioglobus japonicus]|nr:Naphthalene 1,2-dioxygenase system, ferredoxin component [Halioglobus japonicus]